MKIFKLCFVALLSVSALADDLGYSREGWEKIMLSNIDFALDTNYAFLAKSYMDAAIVLESQVEQDATLASMIAANMGKVEEILRNTGARNPAPALKESRLLLQAADAVQLHNDQMQALQARFQKAYQGVCEEESIKRVNGVFSSSGFLNAKAMIEDINHKIDEVIKYGIDGIYVTVGYMNGQQNYGGAQVSGNDRNLAMAQSAIITGFMALGVIVGTAIPVIGNILGGIIGFIIGTIIAWVVGLIFGNPSTKVIGKLRDQVTYVVESVAAVERRGLIEPSSRFCRLQLRNEDLVVVVADVDRRARMLNGKIQDSVRDIRETGARMDSVYREELERLKNDVYPTVRVLVNNNFEACYADVQKRSEEGRTYARTELSPSLKALVAGDSSPAVRYGAEQELWNRIVDGEIKYSATNAFGFQKEASFEAKELTAWDGVARAVFTRLDRIYSTENSGGRP